MILKLTIRTVHFRPVDAKFDADFQFWLNMISSFQEAIDSPSSSHLWIKWVYERLRNGQRKFKLAVPLYRYNKGLQYFIIKTPFHLDHWLQGVRKAALIVWIDILTFSHASFDRFGILVQTDLTLFFHKNMVFTASAKSSYFSTDFRLKIFLWISF